jgi:hypothetical protein
MIPGWWCWRKAGLLSLIAAIVLGTAITSSPAQSKTCVLPSQHAGMTFPVEQIDANWTCRLQPIIEQYTTANKVGPLRTPVPKFVYFYLLDHPPLAAGLINRLDLGLYKSEARGPGRFWGDDGEGTSGIVELVHQDNSHRVYYLEGSHDSAVLPHITGRAVVFVKMNAVKDAQGNDGMETTLVAYTKLDSRILAGLASLIRPLIGSTVARKLTKGVEVVNRLGQEMRQHPDRVLFEALDPPSLADDEVAFFKQALKSMRASSGATRSRTSSP